MRNQSLLNHEIGQPPYITISPVARGGGSADIDLRRRRPGWRKIPRLALSQFARLPAQTERCWRLPCGAPRPPGLSLVTALLPSETDEGRYEASSNESGKIAKHTHWATGITDNSNRKTSEASTGKSGAAQQRPQTRDPEYAKEFNKAEQT